MSKGSTISALVLQGLLEGEGKAVYTEKLMRREGNTVLSMLLPDNQTRRCGASVQRAKRVLP